ncbi:MAG: histidine--tRNA ligase [Pseudomonadota bacterium]|nr:histidine--tRNA ligase [Pseudomonadota bacterium]
MSGKLQAVRGMNDLLPEATGTWQRVEETLRRVGQVYGYREIRTPVVEKTELFRQSIGEQTDIVEKEMYTFADSGGELLTLRPEGTASCVRAGVQHGLFHNRQERLWYMGPMFRRERPQKGRYRQFHQFGVEAIGWPGPDVDAEVILIGERIWRELGVEGVRLELNTLGSPVSRARYRASLIDYLAARREALDGDSWRRLESNPLRILDSKVEATREIVAGAPDILDFLDDEARAHFDGLRALLDKAGVDYRVNSRLVRGLDYYTSTVFEWTTDRLGAQGTVCAGGRYDGLIEQRGGRPTPAAGFATGLERLIELLVQQDAAPARPPFDIYLARLGAEAEKRALVLAETLRNAGLSVIYNCGGGKLKNQLRRADASGAELALILGEEELAGGVVQIKFLRREQPQETVAVDQLEGWLGSVIGDR